jgi:hypothetical protein
MLLLLLVLLVLLLLLVQQLVRGWALLQALQQAAAAVARTGQGHQLGQGHLG